MRRDLAEQRDVFFFFILLLFLTLIQRARLRRRRRRPLVPPKFLSQRELCPVLIKTFADERRLASNLGISFFPSYCFGVAVKGNSIVLETYPSPRL